MALRKRRVTFKICFRKRGVPRKGGSLRKKRGGSNLGRNHVKFINERWLSLRLVLKLIELLKNKTQCAMYQCSFFWKRHIYI